MAISFIKKTPSGTTLSGGGAGTSASVISFGSNVTSGNLIVVILQRWREASGTLVAATISDTSGNTWYKDSGQGYLFYDSNKSKIKFRAVK